MIIGCEVPNSLKFCDCIMWTCSANSEPIVDSFTHVYFPACQKGFEGHVAQ